MQAGTYNNRARASARGRVRVAFVAFLGRDVCEFAPLVWLRECAIGVNARNTSPLADVQGTVRKVRLRNCPVVSGKLDWVANRRPRLLVCRATRRYLASQHTIRLVDPFSSNSPSRGVERHVFSLVHAGSSDGEVLGVQAKVMSERRPSQ